MLESLFFGFSLAIPSHLAVQCDDICFVMLDTVILLTVVLLHILNHFFIQFSRCDLGFSAGGGLKWTRTIDLTLIRRAL